MKIRADTVALAALLFGYVCVTLSLGNAPLTDVPNHLARAHIIADLLFNDGLAYGRDFQFHVVYGPYLLGDLVLALLDRCLGASWAARLWITAPVLLIPFAARFALKSLQLPPAAVNSGAILSLYLATDLTFAMGFIHFTLGLACALFVFGWFIRALDSNKYRVWAWYSVLTLLGYAMHLSALVFICAFVGTMGLWRVLRGKASPLRAAMLLAMPGLLLALHFIVSRRGENVISYPHWASLHWKLFQLLAPAIRYRYSIDVALFAGFMGTVLLSIVKARAGPGEVRSWSLWVCAAMFVALYFALPSDFDGIYFVDIRALSYAWIFLMLAGCATAARSPNLVRTQIIAACCVAGLNLVHVATTLEPEDHAMGRYRVLAAMVPAGAHVLPINARPPVGNVSPLHHAGAYITLDARALTPNLFAGDRDSQFSYFSYIGGRGYGPVDSWYELAASTAELSSVEAARAGVFRPDWHEVEQQFQYLLVTVPWDTRLIPPYPVVASNETAALLRVQVR